MNADKEESIENWLDTNTESNSFGYLSILSKSSIKLYYLKHLILNNDA